MLLHSRLILLIGTVLVAALATPALGGTLYRWTAEDGSVAVTDDPKRIPERYRSQAETLNTGGLDTYARFTPSDSAKQNERQMRLQERIARLREINRDRSEVPLAPPGAAAGPASETIVQVNDSTALRIPATESDEGPIIVEEVRVRRKGSNITVHDTVVRQGDKVLVVVRPANWMQGGPDYIDEDEIFE
jgi:hypothetical protein